MALVFNESYARKKVKERAKVSADSIPRRYLHLVVTRRPRSYIAVAPNVAQAKVAHIGSPGSQNG